MTRLAKLVLCLLPVGLGAPGVVNAQTTAAPVFEVATIRPSGPNSGPPTFGFPSNQHFVTKSTTLAHIIKHVYGLNKGSDQQLAGGPVWMQRAEWDIDAKPDEATAAQMQKLPMLERIALAQGMVQRLLEERFHLKAHKEMRELRVDGVRLANGGAKMESFVDEPPKDGSDHWQGLRSGRGSMQARGATMALLLGTLSSQPEVGGRLLVDQTGLTARYNFKLEWTPMEGGGARTDGVDAPTLFTAMEEQLGLKVASTKAKVEVLVIDSLDRPTEN